MEKKRTRTTKKTAETVTAAVEKASDVAAEVVEKMTETAAEVKEKVAASDLAAKAEKAVEKAVKKPASRRTVKETMYLQYLGKEINKDDIVEEIKKIWTGEMGRKISQMKTLAIYLKPEENAAYYVINDEVRGSVSM